VFLYVLSALAGTDEVSDLVPVAKAMPELLGGYFSRA